MSIETVFGSAGHDHITGAQLARMIEGTVGKGDYVLHTQNELAATMQTANTVRIDTGDLVHDGRLATCERYTDLTVDSGVSGMRRHDLVVARFSKASDQHQLVVVKGSPTAGEPTDPKLNDGAAGIAATADMPLWRVKLDGISPTLERVFEFAPTSKELRDSASRLEYDTGWVNIWESDTTHCRARRIGRTVFVKCDVWNGTRPGNDWTQFTTLDKGFRPDQDVFCAGSALSGRIAVNVRIETSGLISVICEGESVGYWTFSASFPAA